MNAAEAVRFVTLHFLDTYKENLDEDNYETAKLLIEQTPQNKVVKKVNKILKPFAQQSERGQLTKKTLMDQGWIDQSCKLSSAEIKEMGKQAEMAYSLCLAIEEMPEDKLKGIEDMASTIQVGIEAQLGNMSEEDKSKLNPVDMISSALGQMDTTGEIGNVVSSLFSAIAPDKSSTSNSKKGLLEAFSQLDGNMAKKK